MAEAGLEDIQGNGTVAGARGAVAEFLKTDGFEPEHLYFALRTRVWAMLDARSREAGELRDWYELLRRVSAFLTDSHPIASAKVRVLSDLLYESIAVTDSLAPGIVLDRPFQRDLVAILAGEPTGRVAKRELPDRLGLAPVNVDRILRLALRAGLVEIVGPESARVVRLGWEGRVASPKFV